MENATAGSANAILAISGTTATAQQTPNNVSPMMARCAAGEATASVGNASAQNLVPLERLVRNALPVQVSAALKGIVPAGFIHGLFVTFCGFPVALVAVHSHMAMMIQTDVLQHDIS